MKWRVQIEGQEHQYCNLPAQISESVPFIAELKKENDPHNQKIMRRGRHVLLLHDIGEGLCLEEVLTVWEQERVPRPYGRSAVQVLYATRAGHMHYCRAEVAIDAVSMPTAQADELQAAEIISPLAGKVIKVLVAQGKQVKKGDPLLIIEAMKMENVVQAEGSGVVAALNVAVGAVVSRGDILLALRGEH